MLASIFLWFSCGFPTLSALGRWLEYLHRLPPRAGARFHFPMVFLWFSYIARFHFPVVFPRFSTLSVLGRWLKQLRRPAAARGCWLRFSFGFPMDFHTFRPGLVAEAAPSARRRARVLGPAFPWFSYGKTTTLVKEDHNKSKEKRSRSGTAAPAVRGVALGSRAALSLAPFPLVSGLLRLASCFSPISDKFYSAAPIWKLRSGTAGCVEEQLA